MSGFRVLKNDPFQKTMYEGQAIYAMNANVSLILTPMANTDIKRAESTGDWSELIAKAEKNRARFLRDNPNIA